MAKWMARSQGKLIKRLQLAVQPTEGQSTAAPQWHDLNLEGLEDLVALVNDKTETSRTLLKEIADLKVENTRLQAMAYGRRRPEGEFARGGFLPKTPPGALFGENVSDCVSRIPVRSRTSGFPPIVQEPGVITIVNAPDASNGEIAENIRRFFSRASFPPEAIANLANLDTSVDHKQSFQDLHLCKPYSVDTPTKTDSSSPTPSE